MTTADDGPPSHDNGDTNGDSLSGHLAAAVNESISSNIASFSDRSKSGGEPLSFRVTKEALSNLSGERTRIVLAETLGKGLEGSDSNGKDIESPSDQAKISGDILKLVNRIREMEESSPPPAHSPQEIEADKNAEVAAAALASVLLCSSPEQGISPSEIEQRLEVFGSNAIADKELDSFLKLCWEAVQDFVLVMLIILGIIIICVETLTLEEGETCGTCWLEGFALLMAVLIVVLVTASIDYAKQFAFIRLTRSLLDTNTKSVIRDGQQVSIIDDDIVVGDILSVNSHNLASIPADCVLLGPDGGLRMDESTLTGESKQITKKPGDVVLSGTTAVVGSGKMVVIAVGVNSVAGKIKARVYDSGDHEDDLGDGDENSPLFVKLDRIAKQIGMAGMGAALVAFAASCIIGLAIEGESVKQLTQYLVLAITVLAVAVPEGLPLAVTLALAFSSSKMMKEQNLVKHLDACETMGCATTICTDKTGTLTANKMTARALLVALKNYMCEDPGVKLGDYVKLEGASSDLLDLLANLVSIDTMNETVLYLDSGGDVEGSNGNPTEVALLMLVHDLGNDYAKIRNSTRGRSDQGELADHLSEGKLFDFSSARKMMSYAVPREGGGYRLYCKGAQEVILSRCDSVLMEDMATKPLTDEDAEIMKSHALTYTRRGMRCLGLAYRDLPEGFDMEQLNDTLKNSDGTDAFEAETGLIAVGLVGIEDPLRAEVPDAIQKCYEAGIDVRLVTGDNPNTAVSIAYQAGILRDEHFFDDGTDQKVASNLKENVMLEGKAFRQGVYRENAAGDKEFDQVAFDRIWPHLRVLARSSPDDKLTLAHGLNQSNLYAERHACNRLLKEENISIFPDRQVVAMTGDGTNDAPALKRADIGFAMGVSGTQIAKDAADIILLDDNFASIVTAAKWGRNVYASIQKFLQFQLTVNMAAVVTALVGAFAHQTSPLAAIQLLWVNLLMDSLASLALASEPPVDTLLQKPPVNRTDSMITRRMWTNMVGQATYQIIVVMILLFLGPDLLDVHPGHEVEEEGDNSVHYTLIFNTFVWMTLFNEINCRKLKGEFNVFAGIQRNPLFCGILVTTAAFQAVIVQFGGDAMHVAKGGLDGKFWGISVAFGAGALPVQQLINVVFLCMQKCKALRNKG